MTEPTGASTSSSSATDRGGDGGGIRMRMLAFVGALFIRLLRRSVRLRFHGDATVRAWERGDQRFLLAFWHRHLLLMRYAYRGQRMCVLVSRSRDGELISRVLAHLGIQTSRGSSSRGGALGLRDLLRVAARGSDIAVTPDGPRGPLRVVQPGVVLAAAASGLPVVPVALAATRRHELRSWDRMPVPLPGARVDVVYGDALRVPRAGRPEEWAPRIAAALDAAERRAEELARGGGEER
jgi:lysophospholipid acyltransferase (LPLAT)-like uncharacterized protein